MYAFVGVTVLWRRPGHGIGRLALAIGLAFTVGVLLTTVAAAMASDDGRAVDPGPPTAVAVRPGAVGVEPAAHRRPGPRDQPAGHLVPGRPPDESTRWSGPSDAHRRRRRRARGQPSRTDDARDRLVADRPGRLRTGRSVGVGGIVLAYVGAFVDLCLRYRGADVMRRTQMRWVLGAEATTVLVTAALIVFGRGADWLWPVWLAIVRPARPRHRRRDHPLPPVRHRPDHQPVHLVRGRDRRPGRGLRVDRPAAAGRDQFGASRRPAGRSTLGSWRSPRWPWRPCSIPFGAGSRPPWTVGSIASATTAAGLVAGFCGRLRDQLDLSTVSRELRATTVQALEPATTGVWLRPDSREGRLKSTIMW